MAFTVLPMSPGRHEGEAVRDGDCLQLVWLQYTTQRVWLRCSTHMLEDGSYEVNAGAKAAGSAWRATAVTRLATDHPGERPQRALLVGTALTLADTSCKRCLAPVRLGIAQGGANGGTNGGASGGANGGAALAEGGVAEGGTSPGALDMRLEMARMQGRGDELAAHHIWQLLSNSAVAVRLC